MKLSAAGQKVAAVMLAVGLLLYLWTLVLYPPIQRVSERSDALSRKAALLARYEWLITNGEMIEEKTAELSTQSMKRLLYSDISASQASVHFQNRINQMLIGAGANIQQLDILTPQDQGVFTKISLRMAVTLTQRELLSFLSSLQNSDKLYIVSTATLRSNDDLRNESEPQLFFQAEMSAYLEGGLP